MALSFASMAQKIVKGKIFSADNQPIHGATVGIKGANTQTLTDENGNFSIQANDNDILIVSNVGFATTEVPASNASLISLSQTANDLNEVVVTALGIKKEKKKLGWIFKYSTRSFY